MLLSSLIPVLGATISVTSTADSGPGTLRAALTNVSDGDIINAKGVSGTIQLTSGELEVTNGVTIIGPGPSSLSVDGNGTGRVMNMNIPSAQGVTIIGLTITNGVATNDNNDSGGGIYNNTASTLTLSNCAFAGNNADFGGAVFVDASSASLVLTVINCSFMSNSANVGAGAISAECDDLVNASQLLVTNSVFNGNQGRNFGDAINSYGLATVVGSTFINNGNGGASHVIENSRFGQALVSDCVASNNSSTAFGNTVGIDVTLTVTNCTVTHNLGLFGGAFYNGNPPFFGGVPGDATTYVYHCNVSDNFCGRSGGAFFNIGTGFPDSQQTVVVADTVVSNNVSVDFGGAFYNCGTNNGNVSLIISNSTLVANQCLGEGGGIFNNASYNGRAVVLLVSSTFAYNHAAKAGVMSDSELNGSGDAAETIVSCTFYDNSATLYGSIYHMGLNAIDLAIGSTIFEKDHSPGDNITLLNPNTAQSLGHNLCDDAGGGALNHASDLKNVPALLGPLQDNGGPTPTCRPPVGSLAINRGFNFAHLATDQRGFPRTQQLCLPNGPSSDGTDIGAVEHDIPETIVVKNTREFGDGSLWEAIQDANVCPDVNTITFAPGVSGTVTLESGALDIISPVVLIGPGATNLTIDGSFSDRVFFVHSGISAVITGVTISNGMNDNGGGIYNDHGFLTVSNCFIVGNVAGVNGGAIYNNGNSGTASLSIYNCTLSRNSGGGSGGAIYNDGESGNASLTVLNSTFSTNRASSFSGGIENDGFGGTATVDVSASTFCGDSTTNFGGIIHNYGLNGTATFNVGDTILSAGSSGSTIFNVNGTVTSLGYNLSSDDGSGLLNGPADQINTNPQLGPLQNNGGSVFTHALPASSPAVDKGKNLIGYTNDLRGAARTVDLPDVANAAGGDGTDIGAFEYFPPTIYTVVNLNDSGAGSLRQAILDSVTWADTNNVLFDPSVHGTITLTSGELLVTSPINIIGPGANNVTVSGNSASRVFSVAPGLNVTIAGLTISNGTNVTGGGIFNDHSMLSVSNCAISGNSSFFGGGIYNNGGFDGSASLSINASTLSGNISQDEGGGIYNDGEFGNATATVFNSTFSGNSDVSGGAAIWIAGTGGNSTVTVSASTFSGNITGNPIGGGIHVEGPSGNAVLNIGDSILNAGVSSANIDNNSGTVTSFGYNLSSDNGGGFLNGTADQINTNPQLGPLQNNGGSTLTHALLDGSPAIDKGKADAVVSLMAITDQRGIGRPIDLASIANATAGDGSDIGALEAQLGTASTPILLGGVQKLSDGSFRLSFTNTPGAGFTILSSTNVALPLSNWIVLGAPTETSSGHFQYTDSQATNQLRRFYNVRSP